jgi:hypothetical protein
MATVYKIKGDDTDYLTEDDARMGLREPHLGKSGSWEEERTSDGSLKVTFVETTPARGKEKGRTSWTIKLREVDTEQ